MKERAFWEDYITAYEECLSVTSTRHAPWYVVPADDKENSRLVVSQAILDAFRELDLSYPKPSKLRLDELQAIRQQLVSDDG